jgi:2-methylcitrate dehydratase PrpD
MDAIAGLPDHALSDMIATAAAALDLGTVPDAALDTARGGIADCLGVLIAGATEPTARIVRAVATADANGSESRLLPDGARCAARTAALVNGVAAHVLDYDDVAMDGHPTAVLLPALLAEAEAIGANSGALLTGYVAGYETWAVLRATARVPLHSVGWHPSGVFGAVAAAVACAVLRRLDAGQIGHAMGIAAAQAGGMMGNFGTGAKSFQTGRAAESGLLAARLAAAGLTASSTLFDRGGDFARLFAGGAGTGPVAAFGAPDWAIVTHPLSIKIYPICYAAHRLVDAALSLHRTPGFDPDRIERIEARLGRVPSEILHATRPADSLAAKFSAEFAVASALLHGVVGLPELRPERLHDPRLQALIAKVTRHTTEAVGDDPPHAPADSVVVHLSGGEALRSPDIAHPSGSPWHPVTRAQAARKFLANTEAAFGRDAAEDWFGRLWTLPPDAPLTQMMPP